MTSYRALATIAPDLLDRLNRLAEAENRSDEDIERVLFSAQRLQSSAPAAYHMMRGICESLRHNPSGVISEFEEGIALGGWTSDFAANYVVSLHEAGDNETAAVVADRALSEFAGDVVLHQSLFVSALNLGLFEMVADIEARLNRMKITSDDEMKWGEFLTEANERGVDVGQLGLVTRTAREFLRANGIHRPLGFYSFTEELGGRTHLSQGYAIGQPARRTHELELALQDRLEEVVAANLNNASSPLDLMTVFLSTQGNSNDNPLHC